MANIQQQPGPVPQMVAGGNRNVKNVPFNNSGTRDWSNGLCDCFGDCGTCVVASFIPCIVYGQNKSRVEHLDRQGFPHPNGGDSCGTDCCLHFGLTLCGCGWALQIGVRSAIRTRYRLSGNGCGDCLAALCCTPCELVQGSRELELEERSMNR